jgi:hypothetical protein
MAISPIEAPISSEPALIVWVFPATSSAEPAAASHRLVACCAAPFSSTPAALSCPVASATWCDASAMSPSSSRSCWTEVLKAADLVPAVDRHGDGQVAPGQAADRGGESADPGRDAAGEEERDQATDKCQGEGTEDQGPLHVHAAGLEGVAGRREVRAVRLDQDRPLVRGVVGDVYLARRGRGGAGSRDPVVRHRYPAGLQVGCRGQ